MSISKMKKVAVIGIDTVKENLISDLMELGAVQITEQVKDDQSEKTDMAAAKEERDGNEEYVAKLDIRINRAILALETLEKYSTEKEPLFKTRRAMKASEFAKTMEGREKLRQDVDHVLDLHAKIHALKESVNRLNSQLSAVTPWVSYDLPLELTETKETSINLGVVPATLDMDALLDRVHNERDADVKELGRDKDLIYLIVITMKDEQEDVMSIMKQHGYTPTPFADFEGTAEENRKRIIDEIAATEKECSEVEQEVSRLSALRKGIECYYDDLVIERDHEKIKEKMLKTKRTFTLEGWVPAKCEKKVTEKLEAHECYYAFRDPEEGDEVPVLIENNAMVYPFESVMEMYSLPDYNGFDPTKFYALFYAMFFGLMLSDAGYGLIISIACFVVLRKYALEGMTYKMVKMFFWCGLSTVFWGALFGGWFGDFIPVVAEVFFNKEITVSPLWFNPIEDPTRLLIWSLVFGVIHLFLGMGIKAYMEIKRGHAFDAFCDVVSWYMVIVGGVMWLAGGAVSDILPKIGMYVTLAGFLVLLLTGGRHNKGFGKITGGLSSVYDVTSYISDILSYARLLALGLATGVIASVINTMGTLAGGGIFGAIVLLIVFVIGHTFNLAINALGAFVHSSRLQYIEFFGKFYEDGGEEFKPFRKNTKYVRLTNDIDGGNK